MEPAASSTVVDQIFAGAAFARLDKQALVSRYDVTGDIRRNNAPLRGYKGQVQQTATVIGAIPPQGIVISQAGTYTLADDALWYPEAVACAAITILASDVVLDLGNHNLKAIVPDNSQIIAGIFVLAATNVTIRNGTLVNMCCYGICAELVKNLAIANVTVSGLWFDNLKTRNLSPAGIHIDAASNPAITGCTVQYLYVTADASAGIQILNTSGGTVSGCRMADFVNHDGSVQGYSYIKATGITTTGCAAENFQSHFHSNILTLGHTVLGFVPIFCRHLVYEDCTATGMTGSCDDCHGMSVFLNIDVTVSGFTAQGVTAGVTPTQTCAKTTGLEVYGANVTISNCAVADITAITPQDKQATGFSAWGVDIKFEHCTAANVTVVDGKGNQNPMLGFGTGYGWAPDPRPVFRDNGAWRVKYSDCSATNCQVGFDTWFHVDSTWTGINCTGCGIDILLQPGGTRTLSGNPGSECNPPITVTLTNIASGNTCPGC